MATPMTTLLPPDEIEKCPKCLPEIDAFTGAVKSMFPDCDTNPAGMPHRAASVLTLGSYHLGILHQHGHPTSLDLYVRSLKRDRAPVSDLNGCRACQDEEAWAWQRVNHLFPGFAGNPEGVQPVALGFLYRAMYWLGILHELEHPVSLTDYAEAVRTGDFSVSSLPPGAAGSDR